MRYRELILTEMMQTTGTNEPNRIILPQRDSSPVIIPWKLMANSISPSLRAKGVAKKSRLNPTQDELPWAHDIDFFHNHRSFHPAEGNIILLIYIILYMVYLSLKTSYCNKWAEELVDWRLSVEGARKMISQCHARIICDNAAWIRSIEECSH